MSNGSINLHRSLGKGNRSISKGHYSLGNSPPMLSKSYRSLSKRVFASLMQAALILSAVLLLAQPSKADDDTKKWGYIDSTGKERIAFEYDQAVKPFLVVLPR